MALTSFELLYNAYHSHSNHGNHLWVLTDALADTCAPLTAQVASTTPTHTQATSNSGQTNDVHLLTNRWDIAQQAPDVIQFNDYDLLTLSTANIGFVYFHIPKEKPVLNHLLKQCAMILSPGGRVFVAGAKSQGIKSVGKNAKTLFQTASTQKFGDIYLCELVLLANDQRTDENKPLDDQNYTELRPIKQLNGHDVYSKPGIYGWNKIDAGSTLLVEHLQNNQSQLLETTKTVLDLGCGYGYLSLSAHQLGFTNIHATDNNAAAILAVEKNALQNRFTVHAWPDDVAEQAQQQFDLIVCNPPFHQGFDHSKNLSAKFCQALSRLLSPRGQALVVVNQFIKLENFTAGLFKRVTVVAENNSYTVYKLTHH